ncbi:MAG: PAS domain S-box protein [Chlorobiales bacterium]|nr:PAS domain S-box protein [Chlorobiales bacterium]
MDKEVTPCTEEIQRLQRIIDEQSLMIDTIPVHIWVLSDMETYGRVNQHHADFMGMKKEDLEFKKFEELLPKDAADVCKQSNRDVFETGSTAHTEGWVSNSKGEQRLLAITKTPKFENDGKTIEYVICSGVDITERRAAKTRLAQSEENFRTFIETIDDIVLIGDTDGQVIYSNPATTAKLGYSPDELTSMNLLDLHPLWAQKEAVSILTDMFNGKRSACPLPLESKTGRTVPVETRIWFGKWNDSNCIFGLVKDLSKEQEALQKFDRLFRTNPALMALNRIPDQTFVDINDSFLRILGYSMDDVIGKTSAELGLFPDTDEQKRAAQMLASYGSIREIELKVKMKTGSIRNGLFSGEIIESQGSSYFLTVMIDITDRKRAEAEREKTIQELQSALEQIKTLRGIVPICSHCKKIRDDKGYWEKVEAYVSRHTEVRFSHDICPECVKKVYPELSKGKTD